MDHEQLVKEINKFVKRKIRQGYTADELKWYNLEFLESVSERKAWGKPKAQPKPKPKPKPKAGVAAEGITRRPPPPPPPPADSIAAEDKEENRRWWSPWPPRADLPPGEEVSVPETTSSQPREVPTTSVQDDEWRTSEDPEYPQFKRFKGSGKKGSNGIPLVDGGASEDLLNNPKETQNIIPAPLPAYSREEIWSWFSDGTYTRPRDGFWKGGRITNGQDIVWEGLKRGKNGGESTKTICHHGVVCGVADSESVYVK